MAPSGDPNEFVRKHVTAYGVRFGYWPCLEGPYIQFAWGKHRFDLWYGLPAWMVND